ncbi:YjbH domain-containing protein [Stenotrophomonas sp. Iso1]|uniref:YjbH domain-containing protein n=1 Tax=Stenotrophomonas sp. Iso1 TaxID=2977283 RepID=UPI0022B7A37E|nr:YjbH domain-containing protein [Stenotrophomonas sp. Iso1]
MKAKVPPSPSLASAGLALLTLGICNVLQAQERPAPTASDWGGIGLLQTPTARMAEEGELSFTASHTSPYSRYTMSLQPLPWLEGSFRYISVANRRYGLESLSGAQNYKDKSIDFKVRLLRERRWLPEIAAGVRDVGGTGLFSSEYLVANKRWGQVDASLGLATGYIGNRGDFGNPLRHIDDRFATRPGNDNGTSTAGSLNTSSMLRGPVGLFGGLTYQTPWKSLQLKLEYEGNDYTHEPQQNHQRQRSPLNLAATYMPHRNVQLLLGWERGDEAVVGISIHGNLGRARQSPKPLDPLPIAVDSHSQAQQTAGNWSAVVEQLEENAGLRVSRISRKGPELVVTGEQQRFIEPAKALGRTARIVDASAPVDIEWLTVRNTRFGLPVIETSIERRAFNAYTDSRVTLSQLAHNIEVAAPSNHYRHTIYEAPQPRFNGEFNVGYRQSLGGPDGFILFQLTGLYTADMQFSQGIWLHGMLSYNAYNNYDKFRYDAPSKLPRVRTHIRQYLTTENLTLPNFQLTTTAQLGRDWYGMAYAGLLETMYAGVGAELLYRPFNQPWALGWDLNLVRQRGFDQRFSLRDYRVTTGHASLYYTWGTQRTMVGVLSAGRYLAKDWGATLSVTRMFENGVGMGAYATKTNVSSEDFGEGSFDKGIFVSVPFDLMLPRSTRSRASFNWNPLYRDGGARLSRTYNLYQITAEREPGALMNNLPAILE